MPRLGHVLGRARLAWKRVPADASTFLSPAESAALYNLVSHSLGPSSLTGGEGKAILSAVRKLDAGRSRVPVAPRLIHRPEPQGGHA